MNRTLREMILGALDDAGGQAYLAEQARENPVAFMALLAAAGTDRDATSRDHPGFRVEAAGTRSTATDTLRHPRTGGRANC
jgi:hypothetical protein